MRNIRLQFVILAMVFASFGIVQLGRALQDFHRNYFWTPTTRQESLEKGIGWLRSQGCDRERKARVTDSPFL